MEKKVLNIRPEVIVSTMLSIGKKPITLREAYLCGEFLIKELPKTEHDKVNITQDNKEYVYACLKYPHLFQYSDIGNGKFAFSFAEENQNLDNIYIGYDSPEIFMIKEAVKKFINMLIDIENNLDEEALNNQYNEDGRHNEIISWLLKSRNNKDTLLTSR